MSAVVLARVRRPRPRRVIDTRSGGGDKRRCGPAGLCAAVLAATCVESARRHEAQAEHIEQEGAGRHDPHPATPEEALRFRHEGTPSVRCAYPEDVYPGDPDVARVKRAARRCGRAWATRGRDDGEAYRNGMSSYGLDPPSTHSVSISFPVASIQPRSYGCLP